MSFEPAQPISVITCDQCQGVGCDNCDHLGVYALQDEQPIAFNLPDFVDLKSRRLLKNIFIIKRITLIILVLLIIIVTWNIWK